jgi:hypothetical protein
MKDLHLILRDGDPAGGPEQGLAPAQAAAMRRQILNATVRPDVVRTPWQQPFAVAAMVALTIVAGVLAGMRFSPGAAPQSAPAAAEPADGRRQFQFSTPGGTRIIWVFDPEFQVKETVP